MLLESRAHLGGLGQGKEAERLWKGVLLQKLIETRD